MSLFILLTSAGVEVLLCIMLLHGVIVVSSIRLVLVDPKDTSLIAWCQRDVA